MDHLDSESYWNRSSSVAFSFDDDEDGAIGGFIGGEISATPLDVGNAIFNDDTLSEASFASTVGVLNLSIKSIINDEALRILLQEQSLDDRVMPKGVSPDEELKLLRRQIQTTLYSPSPEATAHKLLLGKNTPLEVFKSLNEKKQLLDTVLANGGGDSVIAVLLFLKKSLNRENFHKILKERSKALDHYISYLRQSDDLDQLIELLQRFGKHQEAALLQFQAALGQQEPVKRKQQLLRLNERYAGQSTLVNLYQQLFHGAYKLHELIEKEQNTLGSGVSYHSPPVDILYACCQKNTNWKEQDMLRLISPQRLTAEQQISASQYEWTTLNERARAQAYGDLESIFERVPTWNPMKTKQFHISFALELAVQRLHELQAPATVLYLFLSKMSNNTEKLALAQRVKCIKAMIDAMAGLKQVSELTQLKDSLPERSEEQFYCENALKGLQSKRWTTDNIKLKL